MNDGQAQLLVAPREFAQASGWSLAEAWSIWPKWFSATAVAI